ncbi:MAG: hypothetical protein JO013_14665 [Alphaproteobacteria bacterium]|nr:hypothetical protein [Alphaproteobacteria bacterium]
MLADAERILRRAAGGPGGAVAALRHDAPHFRGLSSGDAEQLRGHLLAGMERHPEARDLRPHIAEELRTSLSPVVLAGAARAARRFVPADHDLRGLLRVAAERIRIRDERVTLGVGETRTAGEEIEATLALVTDPPPRCCGGPLPRPGLDSAHAAFDLDERALLRARVEDQSGRPLELISLLRARRSVIAFFYTRCMNPSKCSLAITRLGAISRGAGKDWNLLAISYDGVFDTPAQLSAYGIERGFRFGERSRLLRCRAGWCEVRRAFDLRVGYGRATVNEHAREVFVVGRALRAMAVDADLLASCGALERALRKVEEEA